MTDTNKIIIGNDLKSMHIAVYALSLLGGTHKKIHTEDIAKKCMEIAPNRFRWERYDYPDKELVRKALVHASEDKNGSLVAGRSGMEQRGKSRDGWQITPAGAEWLRIHESTFETSLTRLPGAIAPTIPRREAQRFLKTIRSDTAFQIFQSKRNLTEVSRYMFTDLLNCSPDSPAETIKVKFDRLRSTAELVNDKQVLEFLAACAEQFSVLLNDSARAKGNTPL
jgi:hypothetical protein